MLPVAVTSEAPTACGGGGTPAPLPSGLGARQQDPVMDLPCPSLTIVLKYMGQLVMSLFNPSSCLPGRLEPGVLRPYRHVLQRGGRRAPTHHTATSCLHFITLGVKVLSSHLPAPDAPNCADEFFRTRLTVLQLKRSSADGALAFRQ